MASKTKRSIEKQIEDKAKKQLSEVKYFTKTETINSEIETALKTAPSKSGGSGANIPDIKLFLETEGMRQIPVMIEVKGKKGDFIKLTSEGEIDNMKKDGTENFTNINKYALYLEIIFISLIVLSKFSILRFVTIILNCSTNFIITTCTVYMVIIPVKIIFMYQKVKNTQQW